MFKDYESALQLVNSLPQLRGREFNPCNAGNGVCCRNKNVSMTEGDTTQIKDAVTSMKIPLNVISDAVDSAMDPTDAFCPFFDKGSRLCTIYEFRPLECRRYSFGGISHEDGSKALTLTRNIQLNLCDPCQSSCYENVVGLMTTELVAERKVNTYIQNNKTTGVATFVRRELVAFVA